MKRPTHSPSMATKLRRFELRRACFVVATLLAAAGALISVFRDGLPVSSAGFQGQPPRMETTQEQSDAKPPHDLSRAVAAVAFPNRLRHTVNGNALAELTTVLMDSARSMKLRRQAAWRIAKIGSAEAVAVLRQALSTAPPVLKKTIVEALGQSDHEGARPLLEALVENSDEAAARGAVRGLAVFANADAVSTLSRVLRNSEHSEGVRAEAALALGGIAAAEAIAILVDTALYGETSDLVKSAVIALGAQPFSRIHDFFQYFMEPTNADVDLRVLALESLGQTDGQAVNFVLSFLASEEAEIRAAAAWALANMADPGEIALPLLTRLTQEPNPEVRIRLYQALENQNEADPAPLVLAVIAENDTNARIAAMNSLASRLGSMDDRTVGEQFDQLVPWLAQQALNGPDLQTQMSSVLALRLASTPSALQSLQVIAGRSGNPRVAQAAKLHSR